jgi:hypothetical protein
MAGSIQYIKISRIDGNGNDLTTTLESLSNITLPSGSSSTTYIINSRTRANDYYLYYVTAPNELDIAENDKHSPNYNMVGTVTNFKYP